MVSFTTLLTAALATVAAASPAPRLNARQEDCQGVRDAIAANKWPCTEVAPFSCEFCCDSWFSLAGAYGYPCHDDHGDFTCAAGREGFHCGAA